MEAEAGYTVWSWSSGGAHDMCTTRARHVHAMEPQWVAVGVARLR
jgi:hypothetical protein